jgi:hypothetical protein
VGTRKVVSSSGKVVSSSNSVVGGVNFKMIMLMILLSIACLLIV